MALLTRYQTNRLLLILFIFVTIYAVLRIYFYYNQPSLIISPHPDGLNFAFTITDDPDKNKFEKIKIIYDFLLEEKMPITALVWVKKATRTNLPPIQPLKEYRYGDTLEKEEYLRYFQFLHSHGFEIGTHTITAGADYREETLAGYELFKEYFGQYPKMVIMHSHNLENLYWGKYSVSNPILRAIVGFIADVPYSGHIEGSEYFWGDFAKENIKYMRMWGTPSINTLKFNPNMPYHDPEKKYVNYLFSFSDGFNYDIFMDLMQDDNIEQLKEERGISIVYTHFADGFVKDSVLHSDFKNQIRKITRDPQAWLAPASTILDRLLMLKNITIHQRDDYFLISNCNTEPVTGLTILTRENKKLYSQSEKPFIANEENEIIFGSMKPRETIILSSSKSPGLNYLIDISDKSGLIESGDISIHLNGGVKNTGIFLQEEENAYIIINTSLDTLRDVCVNYSDNRSLFTPLGEEIEINDNQFFIDILNPMQNIAIYKDNSRILRDYEIGGMEGINLLWGRILVFLQDGNFLKAKWWR